MVIIKKNNIKNKSKVNKQPEHNRKIKGHGIGATTYTLPHFLASQFQSMYELYN